jgi:hypothetical protein
MKSLLPHRLPKMPFQLIRRVQQVIRRSRISILSNPRNDIPGYLRKRVKRVRQVHRACPTRNGIFGHPAIRAAATTRQTVPPNRGLLSNTGITTPHSRTVRRYRERRRSNLDSLPGRRRPAIRCASCPSSRTASSTISAFPAAISNTSCAVPSRARLRPERES